MSFWLKDRNVTLTMLINSPPLPYVLFNNLGRIVYIKRPADSLLSGSFYTMFDTLLS